MTLKIHDVAKHFGGLKAVNGADMIIEEGKITAIIGPNGSGKSTLFNLISKLMELTRGKIIFNNHKLTKLRDYQVAKLGVSRTFQEVRLFRNLTIQEHLEIAMETKDESLFRSIFSKKKNYDKRINEILDLVELHKSPKTLGSNLSYGQRKLLDLAVAIAKPHSIILLDEPVAGINPKLRQEIKKIIKKLNKNGETILLIEHDMNFVMDLADYIFVMDEGKVIAKGKAKEIQNNKKVLEAYLGN